MDIELCFRAMFNIEGSVDIMKLIDASLTVAALKYPQELSERRERILDTLLNFPDHIERERKRAAQNCASSFGRKKLIIKIPSRLMKKKVHAVDVIQKKQVTQVQAVDVSQKKQDNKKKKDDIELKLDASKRKLKERYAEIEREKGKRKIQVVDFKSLPKARPYKFSCQASRTRVCMVT